MFFSEDTVGRGMGVASPILVGDADPTHDLFCLPQGAGCCGDPLPACPQAGHLCQEFALMWLFLPSFPWAGETGKSPQSSEAGYSVPVTQCWEGNPARVTTTATVGLARPPDLCRFVLYPVVCAVGKPNPAVQKQQDESMTYQAGSILPFPGEGCFFGLLWHTSLKSSTAKE